MDNSAKMKATYNMFLKAKKQALIEMNKMEFYMIKMYGYAPITANDIKENKGGNV